ncbi:MAG TPA: cytochrome P450, partial [Byssovorax sp.]
MHFDDMPVAPGGEGLLGHNGAFRRDRLGMLALMAKTGAPMLRLSLPFPGIRAATIASPEIVQEVFVEKARHFVKSDMLRFSLWNLAGEGLFTSNGELWRRQRRLLAPLFTPKALEAYAGDMVACAIRAVESWGEGGARSLAHDTTNLTMSIAGKTLFEADTFSEADDIGRALTVALGWTGYIIGRPFALAHIASKRALERLAERAPAPLDGALAKAAARLQGPVALVGARGRELAAAIATLDDHVQRMIDDRRRAGLDARADLMSRLLAARDE